jgi:hypothetical protein
MVFSSFFHGTGFQRIGNPSIDTINEYQWISINEFQWISINEFIDGPSMNMVPSGPLWAPVVVSVGAHNAGAHK